MSISEKLSTTSWAKSLLHQLKAELDELSLNGSLNIPTEPGGWWHQYVCPTHHTELLFDPFEHDAETFQCPHGCRIEGDAYRGAWLVFKHQAIARYALQAAAVYAGTKEESYAALAKEIIVSYAAQFPQYPVHPDAQPWMLKGRAFHQALTEAIWATTLLRAYILLLDEGVAPDELESQKMDMFLSMLESSMTQYRHILIHEKNNAENNYTAWLNAALSCVYAARGEAEPLKALIEDKGGFIDHLSTGVKRDQFEFEGSTYYHIFVLRAYLIAAEMAERFNIDLYYAAGREGQCLEGMFEVLIGFADDRGVLPALHDGPLARLPFAREIAEIMEIGLSRYGHAADRQTAASTLLHSGDRRSAYGAILGEVYRQMSGQYSRTTLEALLYGAGEVELKPQMPSRRSLFLADSGFVAGRVSGNELSFLADFGAHGGSHGHYDKLHLSLQNAEGALTPDLGMVPYGSVLRKSWFAETASHNTVSVGGASQAPHTGACKRYEESEEAVQVWLQSEAAYDGCLMDRHLHLTGEYLLDWFEVKLEQPDTIDWWMHALNPPEAVNGQWVATEDTAAASQVAAGSEAEKETAAYGYDQVQIQARFVNQPREQAAVDSSIAMLSYPIASGSAGARLYQTIALDPETVLYRIETPGTSIDPSEALSGLLQRQQGLQSRFVQVYAAGEPAEVQWLESVGGGNPRCIVRTKQSEAVYELDPVQGLINSRRNGL